MGIEVPNEEEVRKFSFAVWDSLTVYGNNFMHNLQNRKSCKVIVRCLAEISQLMHLTISAKLHMLMITRQTQRETVLKKFIRSSKSLKNIVS